MIEGLKPIYNKVLKPLANCGLHPNTVTTIGLLFFIVASAITAIGYWKTGLILGTTGAIMDGLDGVIARETGKGTTFGAFYDSVTDRFTEILWFGALLYYYTYFTNYSYGNLPIMAIFILTTGSLMVSYLRARAEAAGATAPGGILQRPERLILLAIFQYLGADYMKWGLLIVAVMAYITVIQRMIITYKELKQEPLSQ